MRNQDTSAFSLQLFGEEATGEMGVDAALQQGETGEPAPSRASEESPSREQLFQNLIDGEYKDLYEQRVSRIVQKRLKQNKTDTLRMEQMNTLVDTLSRVYGVEKENLEGLQQAVLEQSSPKNTNALAGSVYLELKKQAQQLQKVYPSFNVQKELENPTFAACMRVPQMDMQTAYEIAHKEEILPAVIAATQREVEANIAKSLASGWLRPQENGTAGQSANLARCNVASFSTQQMEDICKRVSRGERVVL